MPYFLLTSMFLLYPLLTTTSLLLASELPGKFSRRLHNEFIISKRSHPLLCQHVELGDVATTFTPDTVADFMTKQTQRLTHERHCRRAFGNQYVRPYPSRTHYARASVTGLCLSTRSRLLLPFKTCSLKGG